MTCRLLLIGGTGFVGLAIKKFLMAQGAVVFEIRRPGSAACEDGKIFRVSQEGDFELGELCVFLASNGIDAIVHCGNRFEESPSLEGGDGMVVSNFVVPARVLKAAHQAGVGKFINLASGWQLNPSMRKSSPDYVSSKEAFRAFLNVYGQLLTVHSVFVNELFGPADSRPKLINELIRCAQTGDHMVINSPATTLGLSSVLRLASEIFGLVCQKIERPSEYLYENYGPVSISSLIRVVESAVGAKLSWSSAQMEPRTLISSTMRRFGGQPMDLLFDDILATIPESQ